MPILVHANGANREGAAAQIDSLVDFTTYNTEKRSICKKTKLSTNEEQWFTRAAERTIPVLKSEVRRGHQTGKNQIMERVLQCDLCDQPLECNIQDGCREDKTRYTHNHAKTTRWFNDNKSPRHPSTNDIEICARRQPRGRHRNTQADPNSGRQANRHGRRRGIYSPRSDERDTGHGNKKAPGEDGIPIEMWKCVGAILPRYLTAIYNGCLKEGVFPKRWIKARIIPIVKPGKEGSDEVNNYRPISLLDAGSKVLEKLLINRINQHAYSRGHMNENHFGFRPQKKAR
jgi:hypothetical protein